MYVECVRGPPRWAKTIIPVPAPLVFWGVFFPRRGHVCRRLITNYTLRDAIEAWRSGAGSPTPPGASTPSGNPPGVPSNDHAYNTGSLGRYEDVRLLGQGDFGDTVRQL